MALVDVPATTDPLAATTPFPATKFSAPEAHPGMIRRAAALRQLDAATAAPAIIVTGWPGSGKTQLLTQWIAERAATAEVRPHVAWISCDDTDADPTVLSAALLTGLELTLGDGAHGGDLSELVSAGFTPVRLAVAVVNRLVDCRAPVTIVIDDAHRAGDALWTLGPLIERLPAGSQIVMTTTRELPLELDTLRIRRLVVELGQYDLALDLEETRTLLLQHGHRLADDELRHLHDTIEGWLAPWMLLLPHLDAAHGDQWSHRAPMLERIGDVPAIARFLREAVVLALPKRLRDFVSDLALLDEFTPDDCRDVFGDGADVLLDECREREVLVVGTDERRRYRLHRLLRDFLRQDRGGRNRDHDRALHTAAASVCAARDELTRAVRHHMRAGDPDAALAVIAQRLRDGGVECDENMVAEWLDEIHVRGVFGAPLSPFSHATYALALICAGHVERGRHWLATLDQRAGVSDPQVRWLALMAELLAALRDGQAEAVLQCHEALSSARTDRAAPATCECVAATNAAIWLGDVPSAQGHVSRHWDRTGHGAADDVFVESAWAHVLALEGDLNRGGEVARWAIRAGDELGVGDRWPVASAHLALGLVGYEQGDLDDAGEHLAHVIGRFGERAPVTTMLARGAMVRVHLAAGDVKAARRLLSEMAADPHLAMSSPLNDRIAGLHVRVSLAEGDIRAAREFLPRIADPWQAALLRACVGLAAGELDNAVEAIEGAPTPGTRRSTIDLHVVRAQIARKGRDLTVAEDHVRAALELAVSQSAVSPFFEDGIDLWPTVRKVLSSYPNHRFHDAAEHMAKLWRTSQDTHVDDSLESATVGVLRSLRNRELEVLRLIGARYSNREIAAMMYISANTLKTHTRALYRKLNIGSRTEAIALANRIGLA